MSQIYRIEVPARDKFDSSESLPRFVVIVQIPDLVISEFEDLRSPELQLKALGIAMNATWNQRVKYRNFQFASWSSSVVVDADPADYGAPSFRDGDGCRAWIVESPLAARHASLTVRETFPYRQLNTPSSNHRTMRSLFSNGIISQAVSKGTRCSRRIKLWNWPDPG